MFLNGLASVGTLVKSITTSGPKVDDVRVLRVYCKTLAISSSRHVASDLFGCKCLRLMKVEATLTLKGRSVKDQVAPLSELRAICPLFGSLGSTSIQSST